MANQWFRLYNDICTDIKIKLLAFEDRWHYVSILSFKSSGELDKDYNQELKDRMIAMHLGLSISEADGVKKRLAEVGLIDQHWQPLKWDSRQYLSDSSTERVRKHRENQQCNNDETLQKRCSSNDVTPSDTDTDTDTKKRISIDIPKEKQFKRPTIEQIKAEVKAKGYSVDPEKFFYHYEANGWKIGKASMKSWKAALVTWSKNEPKQKSNYPPPKQSMGAKVDDVMKKYYGNEPIKDAEVLG